MAEIIWRPKRPSTLPEELLEEKLRRDAEYELAVLELYRTLPREEARAEKAKLWDAYVEWAKDKGFYEPVTPEQQLAEAEMHLEHALTVANDLRAELGLGQKELRTL